MIHWSAQTKFKVSKSILNLKIHIILGDNHSGWSMKVYKIYKYSLQKTKDLRHKHDKIITKLDAYKNNTFANFNHLLLSESKKNFTIYISYTQEGVKIYT